MQLCKGCCRFRVESGFDMRESWEHHRLSELLTGVIEQGLNRHQQLKTGGLVWLKVALTQSAKDLSIFHKIL